MLRSKQAEVPSDHLARQEALQVGRYVTDMTAQLEAMAAAAHLDLLAYFLRMAKAEGGFLIRHSAETDSSDSDIPSD